MYIKLNLFYINTCMSMTNIFKPLFWSWASKKLFKGIIGFLFVCTLKLYAAHRVFKMPTNLKNFYFGVGQSP